MRRGLRKGYFSKRESDVFARRLWRRISLQTEAHFPGGLRKGPFPQRESDVVECIDSVDLQERRRRRSRIEVENSLETLPGETFFHFAVKRD